MFIRNSDTYINHPEIKSWGLKVVTKMKYLGIMLDSKMDWFPHTQYLEKKATTRSQQPRPLLQNHMGLIIRQLSNNLQTRHTPSYHIRGKGLSQFNNQTSKE